MHRLWLRALRTGSSGRPAASVARLSALAACLGRKRPMLREAALGIRNALPTLASGHRGESPVLREAAFLVRYRLATHARYLPLSLRVHRCEPTVRDAPFMTCSLSHHSLSLYARSPRDAEPAT